MRRSIAMARIPPRSATTRWRNRSIWICSSARHGSHHPRVDCGARQCRSCRSSFHILRSRGFRAAGCAAIGDALRVGWRDSDVQAKRGESTYLNECARCHADTLVGTGDSGPPLVGDVFISGWSGKSVGDLFERIRITMPHDTPGRLTRQQTADVLAYMLQANEFPPGQAALQVDLPALNMIKVVGKTGQEQR